MNKLVASMNCQCRPIGAIALAIFNVLTWRKMLLSAPLTRVSYRPRDTKARAMSSIARDNVVLDAPQFGSCRLVVFLISESAMAEFVSRTAGSCDSFSRKNRS